MFVITTPWRFHHVGAVIRHDRPKLNPISKRKQAFILETLTP